MTKITIADTSTAVETSTTDNLTKDTTTMDTTTTDNYTAVDQSTVEESTARLRSRIAVCKAVTGYSFRDRHLCAEALNRLDGDAALVLKDGEQVHLPENDKLAFYGDVVATSELCRVWIEHPGSSNNNKWCVLISCWGVLKC